MEPHPLKHDQIPASRDNAFPAVGEVCPGPVSTLEPCSLLTTLLATGQPLFEAVKFLPQEGSILDRLAWIEPFQDRDPLDFIKAAAVLAKTIYVPSAIQEQPQISDSPNWSWIEKLVRGSLHSNSPEGERPSALVPWLKKNKVSTVSLALACAEVHREFTGLVLNGFARSLGIKEFLVEGMMPPEDDDSRHAVLEVKVKTFGVKLIPCHLLLADSGSLQTLPEGLMVGGNLDLASCKSLLALPSGLYVEDDLYLSGCCSWDGVIPEDAVVRGRVITEKHPHPGVTLAEWRKLQA